MSVKQRSLSTSSQAVLPPTVPPPPPPYIGPNHPPVVELVSPGVESRNWRGLGIAFLVIIAVCSLIITAIILLSPGEITEITKPRLTLDDLISGRLTPRLFNGSWLSDDLLVYRDGDGNLILHDVAKGNKSQIMSNDTFIQYSVDAYSISPDMRYILLACDVKKHMWQPTDAEYAMYDVRTGQVFSFHTTHTTRRLQHAQWGSVGTQMVFIDRNNMFYKNSLESGPRPIDMNTRPDISNAIPDWIYKDNHFREKQYRGGGEGMGIENTAIWWSPDGGRLCYAAFDTSQVNSSAFLWYGSDDGKSSGSFSLNMFQNLPQIRTIKYPKPGSAITLVRLYTVDLRKDALAKEEIQPPKEIKFKDRYLTGARWMDGNRIAIAWMTRAQNQSFISICKFSSRWQCQTDLEEVHSGPGWVEPFEAPIFTTDGGRYFVKLPAPGGHGGKFPQISMVSTSSSRKRFLTSGSRTVTSILGYNSERKILYFQATEINSPGSRLIFSIEATSGRTAPHVPHCITCNVMPECGYHSAIFSPNAKRYVSVCEGPSPGVKVEIRFPENLENVILLDSNSKLENLVNSKAMPIERQFRIPLDELGSQGHVRLLLPPILNDNEITRYPVILNVDGRPGSQEINQKFLVTWGTYLASARDYIYIQMDGRGSGFSGDYLIHQVFKRLGRYEAEDRIEIIRYLGEDLPFVDGDRVALIGWGYGAYISAISLTSDSELFACGIVVAPITSWRLFDAAFAERYMGQPIPSDNYVGYDKSDVSLSAGNLRGKKLLLVHGTADRHVHIQHSMRLMRALNDNNVTYRTQIYPDEDHQLSSVRGHLYRTFDDFLNQCFAMDNDEEIGLQKVRQSRHTPSPPLE